MHVHVHTCIPAQAQTSISLSLSLTCLLSALVEGCEHVGGLCLAVEVLILQRHVPYRLLVLDTALEQLVCHVTVQEMSVN